MARSRGLAMIGRSATLPVSKTDRNNFGDLVMISMMEDLTETTRINGYCFVLLA